MYGYPNQMNQPNFNAMQFNQNYDPTYNPYQQYQQQNYMKSQFAIKQVSNIEEAKSFIIDAFSTFLFVDYNSGKIYMKRMNNNGGSDFYTFSVEENKQKYDPLSEINQRLLNIENKLGGNYVQSVSSDEKSNAINATASNESNAKTESASFSESTGNDSGKKRTANKRDGE